MSRPSTQRQQQTFGPTQALIIDLSPSQRFTYRRAEGPVPLQTVNIRAARTKKNDFSHTLSGYK